MTADDLNPLVTIRPGEEPTISRRTYLVMRVCAEGAPLGLAIEAVASTAIEHPEWDLTEHRTWAQWEAVHTQ